MAAKLRMAVVGVGHFGCNHVRKIAALDGAQLVAVADIDGARATAVGAEFACQAVDDHRALIGKVDAVCVAVPTMSHFAVAQDFLAHGVHVLVEKPLAHDLESARRLVELADENGAVLHVGHLVRFYGVTEALRRLVTNPLYIDCVRVAPFQPRGTDVNVVLDLMIHDLDLVLSLIDAPVASIDAFGAPVFTPQDIATARIKFANGAVANVTASRSPEDRAADARFEPNAYSSVDFDRQSVIRFRLKDGARVPSPSTVESREETYKEVDALEREIETFAAAAAKRPTHSAPVTGREALRALEIAMQVTEAVRAHAALVAQSFGQSTGQPPLSVHALAR